MAVGRSYQLMIDKNDDAGEICVFGVDCFYG